MAKIQPWSVPVEPKNHENTSAGPAGPEVRAAHGLSPVKQAFPERQPWCTVSFALYPDAAARDRCRSTLFRANAETPQAQLTCGTDHFGFPGDIVSHLFTKTIHTGEKLSHHHDPKVIATIGQSNR